MDCHLAARVHALRLCRPVDDPRIPANLELVASTTLTYTNGDVYKARASAGRGDARRHAHAASNARASRLAPAHAQGEALGKLRHGRGKHTCSTGDYYGV